MFEGVLQDQATVLKEFLREGSKVVGKRGLGRRKGRR